MGGVTDLNGWEEKIYEEAVEQAGIASILGVDNSVKADYLAGQTDDEAKNVFTVDLSAAVATTNGKFTVRYDASSTTLESYESFGELGAFALSEGEIVFGFAGLQTVPAEQVIAKLSFSGESCGAAVTVRCDELNNDHPATEEEAGGAHAWSAWTVDTPATCIAEGKHIRTCGECGKIEEIVIPTDTSNHAWNNVTVVTEASENNPGVKEFTCDYCDALKQEWYVAEGTELTKVDPTQINSVLVKTNYITAAQIHNAGIDTIYRMTTTDGSIRYLVLLSSSTSLDDVIDVKMSHWIGNNTGVGYAIKCTKVESVDQVNDSDLDYRVDLANGIGSMQCWSYYERTNCTEFDLYLMIGENDTGNGKVKYFDTPDKSMGMNDNFLAAIGIRGAVNASIKWEEPVIQSNAKEAYYTGQLFVDSSVSLDGEVVLEFDCDAMYLGDKSGYDATYNLAEKGIAVKL